MAKLPAVPAARSRSLATAWSAALTLAVVAAPALAQDTGRAASLPGLADLPNFVIDGRVRHQGDRWEAEGFSGRIGDLPVRGSIAVDRGGEKPFVSGSLQAPGFDVDSFRSLLEQAGLSQPGQTSAEELIPGFELPTAFLDRLEMQLDLSLSNVTGLSDLVRSVDARISIDERRLALNPLDIRFAGGGIAGQSALNARHEPASADLVIDLEGIDLARLIEGTAAADYVSGIVSGRISLLGTGGSLDQVLATSDGEISLLIEDGWVKGLALEAAGIDIVETLALAIGDSDRIPIDCGRIDLSVGKGIAEITRLLIDTRDSLVLGGGTIDLASEELDLGVQTRSRDFSLIDVAAPVLIGGTLAEPSFSVGDTELFDLFETGNARAVDCARLLEADFRETPQ